jgi:DNA-binding NarL/FixJ family response regulator
MPSTWSKSSSADADVPRAAGGDPTSAAALRSALVGKRSGDGVRLGGDWIRVVDLAHDQTTDLHAWGRALSAALKPVFGGGPVMLHMVRHSAAGTITDAPLVAGEVPPLLESLPSYVDFFRSFTRETLRLFYYPRNVVVTHAELRASADAASASLLREFAAATGIADSIGLVLHPQPGVVVVAQWLSSTSVSLRAEERRGLTWLGLHIEAALRRRLRPSQAVRAVIGPAGRLEHHEPGAPPKTELERAVHGVRRARRRRRDGAEALALWRAVVAGELSIVERVVGSRTYYFFVDNPPHRQPFHCLTTPQQDAVTAVCRAESNKAAAYELGISEAAVSRSLASAAARIGLASRIELVRIAAMLTRDPRARFDDIALTPSEEHVLELLGQGLTNAEIARIRSRSARTIANQVASLLRKASAANRKALVVGLDRRPRA